MNAAIANRRVFGKYCHPAAALIRAKSPDIGIIDMTDRFTDAMTAIVDNDFDALNTLLAGQPDLVTQRIADERFIAAIVHQVYAGDTLLHVAAAAFQAGMVEALLAKGADVHTRNRRGATALHYAADTNRDDETVQALTITCLLKAGADANARDKSGTAPLHRAVRTRGALAVKALLDGGADPNLGNGSGSIPFDLAHKTTGRGGSGTPKAKVAQAEIIQLLKAAGAV